MCLTDVSAQDGSQVLSPANAMTIIELERQKLHEKIVRLRALREAAEADKAPTDAKVHRRRRA
jgi:hypothetical protein